MSNSAKHKERRRRRAKEKAKLNNIHHYPEKPDSQTEGAEGDENGNQES